jgi:hypothetical protein
LNRGERSIGKFGPRKSANDTLNDELDTTQLSAELEEAPAASGGAVRISLADQLWELPFQSTASAPLCGAWPWYDESLWNNVETPEKMLEMQQQYMLMETPDKLMMPFHGMDAAVHQACFGNQACFAASSEEHFAPIAMDSCIVPHKLFDVSPALDNIEGFEGCQAVEAVSTRVDTEIPETHESGPQTIKESNGELSPRPASSQQELLSLKSPTLRFQSPSVGCLASPTPLTPRRQHYVPDTPSPSRMHFSWMQSSAPWQLSAAAFGSYQAMPPEFLQGQSMSYS